jgi:ATP-dependent helicase/DNAse subunit B
MDRVLSIYPTSHKVEDVLRRESARDCAWDYRLFTFPQLVRRLWRECHDGRAAIDTAGERLIVEEALRAAHVSELPLVPGVIDHVHGLIRQFKSAALKPENFTEAIQKLKSTGRLAAVVAIFVEYEAILARHRLADAHDRESGVLEMLHDAERGGRRPAALEGITRVTIAEIYDFSILQFMIVTALIRMIGDASITIQANPRNVDATRFADLTWNRFVAEESIADQVLPEFIRRDGRPGALGFVLEHLFTEPPQDAPSPDSTLEIVRAPSRLGEVEHVAREIRRQLEAQEGISPARIAIVARDLAPYADHLRTVFRRYRIPLAVHHNAPLMTTPTARFLLDLARTPRDGYRRDDLIAILRSPHLGIHNADAAVRVMAGIGYIDEGATPLRDALQRHRDEIAEALSRTSAGEHERLKLRSRWFESGAGTLEFLVDTLAPLDKSGTLAEHLVRFDKILTALQFDPARGGNPTDAARAWAGVRTIRDQLAALADRGLLAGGIQPADFERLLEASLVAAPGPDDAGDSDGVRAMLVQDARGLDFDLVFIIGLDEGTFPAYHGEDPIVSETIRRDLNPVLRDILHRRFRAFAPSSPGKILRGRAERNAEDLFLFFLALSMPARRVVLTYAAAETNPLVRSPFIDEVLRVLGADESRITDVSAGSFIQTKDCFAREEFLELAARDRLLELPGAECIMARAMLDSIARRSAIERQREVWLALPTREDADGPYHPNRTKFATAGRFDGRIAPSEGLRRILVDDPNGWSPTRLDDLGACGFKFFAGRVLRLRDEDEPDYELSALESGSLMHEVLYRVIGAIEAKPVDQARALVSRLLEEIHREKRAQARDRDFFDLEWETIRRVAERAAEYHLAMLARSPDADLHSEHEFSFVLPDRAGGPDLPIHGRIDRVELHRRAGRIERIRVIDYKRARKPDTYRPLIDPERREFGRIAFQVPVYLMGALEEFRSELAPDVKLEGGYLLLRGREPELIKEIPRDLVDPARDARERIDDPVADRIVAIIREAIAGRFDVDPRHCSDYCPFRSVCRNFQRRNV